MMKKIIYVNMSSDDVVEKLNEIVRTNIDIKDKLGGTNYLFWGPKIIENQFLWDTARHVNNLYRIKGKIVSVDDFNTEIHINLIKRLSYYVIYTCHLVFIAWINYKVTVFYYLFFCFRWLWLVYKAEVF